MNIKPVGIKNTCKVKFLKNQKIKEKPISMVKTRLFYLCNFYKLKNIVLDHNVPVGTVGYI